MCKTRAVLLGRSIGVVVPAHREEERIGRVIAGLPPWIDHVVVVDDASDDGTGATVLAQRDPRVHLETHPHNRGVGAAIATGYRALTRLGADVCVVMAGDDQMDPRDLEAVASPVARGTADYVKGNRFLHPEVRRMPFLRRFGSRSLARVTRAASGLDVDDTQCGYTALAANWVTKLPLETLWPRYGYPNDLLLLLAADGARIAEVPVRPVYAGEKSGLRPYHVFGILSVIGRRWWSLRRGRRTRQRGATVPPLSSSSTQTSSLTETSVSPPEWRSSRKK